MKRFLFLLLQPLYNFREYWCRKHSEIMQQNVDRRDSSWSSPLITFQKWIFISRTTAWFHTLECGKSESKTFFAEQRTFLSAWLSLVKDCGHQIVWFNHGSPLLAVWIGGATVCEAWRPTRISKTQKLWPKTRGRISEFSTLTWRVIRPWLHTKESRSEIHHQTKFFRQSRLGWRRAFREGNPHAYQIACTALTRPGYYLYCRVWERATRTELTPPQFQNTPMM